MKSFIEKNRRKGIFNDSLRKKPVRYPNGRIDAPDLLKLPEVITGIPDR